jgi:2-phospho-L-lactate/phosphoenolpyruvate guanylyltransferase
MAARRPPHDATGNSPLVPANDAGVVVPLRSFTHGKARLAAVLDDDERLALARAMADRVIAAAAPRPTVVVTSAPEVVAWAEARGIATIDDPGTLDAAADAGRSWVRAKGLHRVVVAHADLPLATTLDDIAADGAARIAVIVPDHRDDGTPVLAVPVDVPFRFAYGPDSWTRHVEEAGRCGLDVRVARITELRFDVDLPADLEQLAAHQREPAR